VECGATALHLRDDLGDEVVDAGERAAVKPLVGEFLEPAFPLTGPRGDIGREQQPLGIPPSVRSSKKQRRSMTVRLLTTAERGWLRATRPRQGRLWL
jgi:hypothetical protein